MLKLQNYDLGEFMIKNFICDMDGVIYKGKQLIEGAKEFVERLQANNNYKFLFLTNNSEQTAEELKNKLANLGINNLTAHNFITASMATATFLSQQANQRTA